MTTRDPATRTPGRAGPPWTAPDTVFFYGGFLSNFAPTPGLRLPFGYHGHHENDKVAGVARSSTGFRRARPPRASSSTSSSTQERPRSPSTRAARPGCVPTGSRSSSR